ncbi:Olfactory receptor 4D5 [Lemmus lemmus]
MNPTNHSQVAAFVLLGLSQVWELRFLFFTVFSAVYLLTVTGNLLIVAIVTSDPRLHTTMYFLLGNLSFLDFCYSSITAPRMLVDLLSNRPTISFGACLTQLFFFHFIGGIKIFLLTVMAYDRYIAISQPLRYTLIMNQTVCFVLMVGGYTMGFVGAMAHTVCMLKLSFCDGNVINHYMCDIPPLLELSCTSTAINELVVFIVVGVSVIVPSLTIFISYTLILSNILRIHSTNGRSKALSTCSSHMIAVSLFFGSSSFIYFKSSPVGSVDQDKISTVFYTVVIPMMNPFIYSLRNKDVKLALSKTLKKKCSFK